MRLARIFLTLIIAILSSLPAGPSHAQWVSGMNPSASNAVLPTARTNLGAWPQISAVKDLGFVGDGVTDNSSKLATLFAYTTHPTVYFDPGIYMIGCPAEQDALSNISLIGAGIGGTRAGGAGTGGTVLKLSAGCALPQSLFSWPALGTFWMTGYGIEIAKLTIDANFATRTGGLACLLCLNGDVDYSIHDIALINWPSDVGAITANSSNAAGRFHIERNYFLAYNTVTAATIAAGGAGGTNGGANACLVEGTRGTGTKFRGTGTVAANALTGPLVITIAGAYTGQPGIPAVGLAPTAEPVTAISGCGALTGATVNLTTSLQSINQAITVSNSGGAGVADVWVRDNVFVNSGIDIDAHDLYVTDNNIAGWAFGAAISTEASTNSHDLLIKGNILHDSFMGVDSNGGAVAGIETWGSPDTKVTGNICRNIYGTCLDGPGQRGLVSDNRAYGVGKRGLAGNSTAFSSRYQDATYNSNGAMYIGNYANDDGSLTLKYGFSDQSASVSGIVLANNNFAGANTPLNILGSLPVIDALSQNLKSVTAIALDANGKQLAATTTGTGSTVVLSAGGALTGVTGLAVRDTSAAFDVTIAGTSSTALNAGRTLTLDMKNVAHTLAFNATANTITFPNTASYTLIGNGDTGTVTNTMLAGSIASTKLLARASAQAQPGAPTAPNSTSVFKMQGLAGTITPTFSGNILLVISANTVGTTTTAGDGIKIQASYGTSTAPTSNAALTGTQCGSQLQVRNPATVVAADISYPVTVNCIVTGLTLSTAYWLDLAAESVTTASSMGLQDVSISAHEF